MTISKAAALRERRRHCVILDSLFDESFVHLYYFDAVALAYPAGGSIGFTPALLFRRAFMPVVVQFYTRHCAAKAFIARVISPRRALLEALRWARLMPKPGS